jgi:hypothetical protein
MPEVEVDADETYAPTNELNKTTDNLTKSLLVGAMFIATYFVFKGLPSDATLTLRQGSRQMINNGGVNPTSFSFTGYIEGSLTNLILEDVKKALIESGVSESAFTGMTTISETEYITMLEDIIPNIGNITDVESFSTLLDNQELSELNNILERNKMLGRLEDAKTVENKTMSDLNRITDVLTNYDDIQGWKSGYLNACKNTDQVVLIDWLPAGANTCDICQGYAEEGPYTESNYPESPHYQCECLPNVVVPVVIDTTVEQEKETVFQHGILPSLNKAQKELWKQIKKIFRNSLGFVE